MARPKEKVYTAFQQKCSAAADKLLQFQARTLKEDLTRLFNDQLFTDVSVNTGSRSIPLHRCILKARSEEFYSYIESLHPDNDSSVSMVTSSLSVGIEECLRYLYTEDDASEYLAKLDNFFHTDNEQQIDPEGLAPNGIDYPETGHVGAGVDDATTARDLRVISENITNTSLDLVKTEAFSQCQGQINQNYRNPRNFNNSDGSVTSLLNECRVDGGNCACNGRICLEIDGAGEKEIYKLAEAIVDKVLKEAYTIVGCSADCVVTGENIQQRECDEEIDTTVIKHELEEGCKEVCDSKSEKSNTGLCDMDSDRNGGRGPNSRFMPSVNSVESVQKLMERVYGVKTLMRPCSGLGEDLLRMLMNADFTDCVIEVEGELYQAHRCILAARSSYFAAMLGGSWRESEDETILLEGIDGQVLKQTLLYLYGGVIDVDPSCTLGGLVMMADMYGMEGLKEVVAHNLNVQYCHFFHRPCTECIAGVPEALALTMMYNMEAMKEKCVKWINKHFLKVWASKSLATLPQEVLEFCISSAVKDLSLSNILDVMVDCQILNEKTPRLKWTEPVFDMISQLMDAAIEFASQNFISLISGNTFTKIDKEGISFNKQPLEEIFSMIIQALSPENACLAYLSLNKWIKTIETQREEELLAFSEEFVDFVNILFKKCSEHLCLYIHQAANTAQWDLLTKDMQDSIMKEANYVCFDTNRGRMARPKLTSMQKKISATSPLSLKEYFECHFGQSKSPARNVSAIKSQQEAKSGGTTKSTSKKLSSTRGSGPKSGTLTSSKSGPKTVGSKVKDLKESEKKRSVTKSKPDPGFKGTSHSAGKEETRDAKSELPADRHSNIRTPPETTDQQSAVDVGTVVSDFDYVVDMRVQLAALTADLELVDLPESIHVQQQRPMPILNVNFSLPNGA